MMREFRPIDRGGQSRRLVEKRLWCETRHTSNFGNKICSGQGFSPVPPTKNPEFESRDRSQTQRGAQDGFVLLASLALFATACGGDAGPSSEESSAATAAATSNQAALQLTADVATTQLLDTVDGGIVQLSDVVTGDRPVLLWYWAPH